MFDVTLAEPNLFNAPSIAQAVFCVIVADEEPANSIISDLIELPFDNLISIRFFILSSFGEDIN